MRFTVHVLTILFFTAGAALAGGLDPADERVLEDRGKSALRAGAFAEAAGIFGRLAEAHPEAPGYRLEVARCLLETGRPADARAIFEALLAAEPDDILAWLGTARVEMRAAAADRDPARRRGAVERARDALRRGARSGLRSARIVRVDPDFAPLKDDVRFLLDLLREPKAFVFEPEGKADVFVNPLPRIDAPGGDPEERGPASRAEEEAVIARLEALLAGIKKAVAAEDREELWKLWSEAEDLVARAEGRVRSGDLRARLHGIAGEHRAGLPIVRSLLLRSFYVEGERLVGAIRIALEADEPRRAVEAGGRLAAHAARMAACDPEFGTPARALVAEAEPLVARAKALLEIAEIPIRVTAIVLGGGVARAIVNGREIGEKDVVCDAAGRPTRGPVRVLGIRKRHVRFGYGELGFERPIEPVVASGRGKQ